MPALLLLFALLLLGGATSSFAGNLGQGEFYGITIPSTPTAPNCWAGPFGNIVQRWEVAPGGSYTVELTNVFDVNPANVNGNGSINVLVHDSGGSNVPATAYPVAGTPGAYTFQIVIPSANCGTMPIEYGVNASFQPGTGKFVRRSDGSAFEAHFIAFTFGIDCSPGSEMSCGGGGGGSQGCNLVITCGNLMDCLPAGTSAWTPSEA